MVANPTDAMFLADGFPADHPKACSIRILQDGASRLKDGRSRFLDLAHPRKHSQDIFDLGQRLKQRHDLLASRPEAPVVRVSVAAGAWQVWDDLALARDYGGDLVVDTAWSEGARVRVRLPEAPRRRA